MNIRFYNARILTMEKDSPPVLGELWVRDGRVTYIGAGRGGMEVSWNREIDANGNLLMPGFKNAHTHSAMTFLRSYADDMPLQDWLNKQVFPMEAKLRPGDTYHLSRLAILEYLSGGITAAFDMYMRPQETVQACIDSGFRLVLCGAINNFCSNLDQLEAEHNQFNACHELISHVLGFHAEYTASGELMEGIAALAHKYGSPVFAHNSETALEVQECRQRWGTTPTALMDRFGLFNHGGGGYHCIHMSEEDLDIFQSRGLYVVTNPGSNCKLASGIAPLVEMQKRGIPMAIGTDGPASNNCLDMFREMFLATALQKIKTSDASALDADAVLEMATVGGARAMGLSQCDVLAPGKKADVIMIDLHQPNMQPLNHIPHNIVYSGSKSNVKMTMVGGKILYEDGQYFIGEDPEQIYEKANEIITDLRKL